MKRELLLSNDELEVNNGTERIIPELTLLFDFCPDASRYKTIPKLQSNIKLPTSKQLENVVWI